MYPYSFYPYNSFYPYLNPFCDYGSYRNWSNFYDRYDRYPYGCGRRW